MIGHLPSPLRLPAILVALTASAISTLIWLDCLRDPPDGTEVIDPKELLWVSYIVVCSAIIYFACRTPSFWTEASAIRRRRDQIFGIVSGLVILTVGSVGFQTFCTCFPHDKPWFHGSLALVRVERDALEFVCIDSPPQ